MDSGDGHSTRLTNYGRKCQPSNNIEMSSDGSRLRPMRLKDRVSPDVNVVLEWDLHDGGVHRQTQPESVHL
jgi:hypothetical protein